MLGVRDKHELAPGSVVDERYLVTREIARGGMGIVSEAVHTSLRRRVAIKTLTPAAADWSSGADRLVREGRLLALCEHEHVPVVHDAGTCKSHGPYVAMEMIEGRSLDGLLVARGRLDVRGMARAGAQIAAGLARVHSFGVVHRDLKPANVLVGNATGVEVAHLIDFGIASIMDGAPLEEKRLTDAGEKIGTVEFMAPELLLQESRPSAASDVYALGTSVFECLTGHLPFPGGPMATLSAHIGRRDAPRLRSLRTEVPECLDDAVARSLARDPAARLTLDDFARACRDALGSADVPSLLDAGVPPPTRAQRQFVRIPYSAPARLVTAVGSIDGRTEDISEGGVLVVVADGDCSEGERVTVRFPLPRTGRIVVAGGRARWMKLQRGRRAVGVAFHTLAEDAIEEIRGYAGAMSPGAMREAASRTLWSASPGQP